MALFKISKGSKVNLPVALTEGFCWYTYDDSKFYIDHKDENGVLVRKALNAQEAEKLIGYDIATILNSSDVEIPTSKAIFDALETLKTELTNQSVVILAECQLDSSNKAAVVLAEAQHGISDAQEQALAAQNIATDIAVTLGMAETTEVVSFVANTTTEMPVGYKESAKINKIYGQTCEDNEWLNYSAHRDNPPIRITSGDTVIDIPTGLADFGLCELNYIFFKDGKAFYNQGAYWLYNYACPEDEMAEGEAILFGVNDDGWAVALAEPVVTDISSIFSFDGVIDVQDTITIESKYNSREEYVEKIPEWGSSFESMGYSKEDYPQEEWQEIAYRVGAVEIQFETANVVIDATKSPLNSKADITYVDAAIQDVNNKIYEVEDSVSYLDYTINDDVNALRDRFIDVEAKLEDVDEVQEQANATRDALVNVAASLGMVKFDSIVCPANVETGFSGDEPLKISKIYGKYVIAQTNPPYWNHFNNPPVSILIDNDRYISIPDSLEEFGLSEHNYIYFEDGKAYYHQGTRWEYDYNGLCDNPQDILQDGESVLDILYDEGGRVLLATPIITDISHLFYFDGYIGNCQTMAVYSKYNSGDDVENLISWSSDERTYDYACGAVEIVGNSGELSLDNIDITKNPFDSMASVEYVNAEIDNVENRITSVVNSFEDVGQTVRYLQDDMGYLSTEVSQKVDASYVDEKIGDIESVLDSIIAIQNTLIGGAAV